MTEPVNINQVTKLNLGLQETDEVFITRGGAGPYRVPASSFPWQQKGDPGAPGGSWAPVLSLVTDGVRRVHRIVGWVGGTGVEPTTTGYIGAAGIVSNVAEAVDVRGLQGNAGWAPVLALVADGDRRVHQVIDWTGGAGAKPGVGWYVGATGLVELIQDAVNVRGATGGVGWSPVLAIATDGERRVQRVIDWTGGVGTKPTLAGYVGAAGIVATAAEAVDVRGAPGSASWAPVLAIVADGERLVQQVVDWTGGVGAKPTLAGYVGAAGIVATAAAAVNVRGAQGVAGWSQVLAIVVDGERRVQKVVDWSGGAGAKPAVGGYIGQAGLVATAAEAVDVRGSGVVSGESILAALNTAPSNVLLNISDLVLGVDGQKDSRALKNWFDGGIDGRECKIVGDSTGEQLAGVSMVGYAGGWPAALSEIEPSLIGRISLKNHGLNGNSLAGFVSPGTQANAGGVASKLDDICSAVALLDNPLIILGYGINDCRADAGIAGSTYGNAAQLAKANTLRDQLKMCATRLLAANQKTSIIWRMPNGHAPTSPGYLANGVTGQNAMDVYRLVYRGDPALNLLPIDEYTGTGVLFDTLRLYYGDAANAANALVHTDGLHPSIDGYKRIMSGLLRLIAGPAEDSISSGKTAKELRWAERVTGRSPARPLSIEEIRASGMFDQLSTCSAVSVAAGYFDIGFSGTSNVEAWGAASGAAYGSAAMPAIGVGDIIVWNPVGLPPIIMPINRMGDSSAGSYVRWYSGGPDGYYPQSSALPVGTAGSVWRHKWAGLEAVRRNEEAYASVGIFNKSARKNAYRVFVLSTANGSIVVRGAGGYGPDFSAHTMLATDRLHVVGVESGIYPGGVILTGATFTPGAGPGAVTIALAGMDFTKASARQAVILSDT